MCLQISSAILSALRCRQLGEDYSVLMADYSVVCFGGMDETAASDYKKIRVAAVVLTLLVPVGVPAVLLLILWRQWRVSKGRWLAAELEMHDLMRGRMVNSGQLADHLRSSLADEHGAGGSLQVETLEEYHYARIQATFGVIVDDFKPQYWWFEPVDSTLDAASPWHSILCTRMSTPVLFSHVVGSRDVRCRCDCGCGCGCLRVQCCESWHFLGSCNSSSRAPLPRSSAAHVLHSLASAAKCLCSRTGTWSRIC